MPFLVVHRDGQTEIPDLCGLVLALATDVELLQDAGRLRLCDGFGGGAEIVEIAGRVPVALGLDAVGDGADSGDGLATLGLRPEVSECRTDTTMIRHGTSGSRF